MKARVIVASLLLVAATAAADLGDDVKQQAAAVESKRDAEARIAAESAKKRQQRALSEIERAEKKARETEARIGKLADEAEKAHAKATAEAQAADGARADADRAREAAQAARSLQLAAAKVKKGESDVDALLAQADKEPSLKLAAKAVAGAAAYLKKDDARALALIDGEVLGAMPSAARWVGLARLRMGDKDAAFAALQSAPLDGADVVGNLALGELAAARNDHETARRAFAAALQAAPHDGKAAMGLSRALFALGRRAEALAPLTTAAADAGNEEAAYLLAVASERSGDSARAELAWSRVVGDDEPHAAISVAHGRLGRRLEVIPTAPPWDTAPDALDINAARRHLAWLRLGRGDYDGALRLLHKALDGAELRYLRGLCELRADRLDDARNDLMKAAKLAPARLEAWQALGLVMLQLGDLPRAREALAVVPGDDLSSLTDAVAEARLGLRGESEAALRKLGQSKLYGGVVADAAATDLASLLRDAGRPNDALKALPERPLSAEAHLLRAQILLERDPKGAAAAARRALERAPNFADAELTLARALESAGDIAGASEAAHRTLEMVPDAVDARILLARVYGRQNDLPKQSAELAKIREVGEKIAAAQPRRAVAVVAFDNNTGDTTLDWMRQGVAEALMTDLGRIGTLTLIERTQVQKGFQEQRLQELGFADPSAASKVGKLVGADALLVGQIAKSGDELRLDGRVVEVGSNKVLRSGSATGKQSQLFDVERRLALDLVGEYAAVTARERGDFFAAEKPSMGSLESMARIRMLSTQGRAREARTAFAKLLAEDPKAAEKLKSLEKSWSDAGATVAVAPLVNASGRAEDLWLGVGLAESLVTDLRKVGLYLVERQQVEKLMQERRLTEVFNEEQAVKLGKLVGATLLVIGSYQVNGAQLRIDARLVDVSTGEVLQSYAVEGKRDELFAVERKLIADMAAVLKVDPSQIDDKALAAGKPSLDDFRRYIKASSRLLVAKAAATVQVHSLAVATLRRAEGGDDAVATAALKLALEEGGGQSVRLAAAEDPKRAGADALVVGTVSRLDGLLHVDVRALSSLTGEVIGTATAEGPVAAPDRPVDAAARALMASLGLNKKTESSHKEARRSTPLYKQWWLWTLVGAVVVGGVTAGAVLGTQQSVPSSNSTIIAR